MPVERRGQVTDVGSGPTGNRKSPLFSTEGGGLRVVPPAGESRRAAQQATTCSNRAPAWLDGVARSAGEEGLNHQVVSFKSPADTPKCPECCGNPRLLCRGTSSSNPSPSSGESTNFRFRSRFPPGSHCSEKRRGARKSDAGFRIAIGFETQVSWEQQCGGPPAVSLQTFGSS